MIAEILVWMGCIVAVEALTEIIVASDIATRFRTWFYNLNDFTAKLISCGYCLSVWVSMPFALVVPNGFTDYFILNWVISVLILHRLSNATHGVIGFITNGAVPEFVLNLVHHKNGEDDEDG